MFVANEKEVINLNLVRCVQFFSNDNPVIRLNIDEKKYALLRFSDKTSFAEAQEEIINMLNNVSPSWKLISRDLFVRTDKLQYANTYGAKFTMFFDTGMVQTTHKNVDILMETLADVTRAFYLEEI